MKTSLSFTLTTTIIAAIISCTSIENTSKNANLITNKVMGKKYSIDVRMAEPMRGKTVPLSYGYELTVKADTAYAYLPYYGVAQRVPYGNTDGGIKFKETIKDYSIHPNKKENGWDISFSVDGRDYDYRINLSVFDNGNATITVNSADRDVISFWGEVKR
ncbi:MAG: DUF4251 domain-containing protein [Prevotellaceae bacterium]|jgi:hypothetical protein|nr:DUF4251 domain-containing protein [Prevotellaceae bacterium]